MRFNRSSRRQRQRHCRWWSPPSPAALSSLYINIQLPRLYAKHWSDCTYPPLLYSSPGHRVATTESSRLCDNMRGLKNKIFGPRDDISSLVSSVRPVFWSFIIMQGNFNICTDMLWISSISNRTGCTSCGGHEVKMQRGRAERSGTFWDFANEIYRIKHDDGWTDAVLSWIQSGPEISVNQWDMIGTSSI